MAPRLLRVIDQAHLGLLAVSADVAGLDPAVSTVAADIAGLEAAVSAVATDVAGLEAAVSAVAADIGGWLLDLTIEGGAGWHLK